MAVDACYMPQAVGILCDSSLSFWCTMTACLYHVICFNDDGWCMKSKAVEYVRFGCRWDCLWRLMLIGTCCMKHCHWKCWVCSVIFSIIKLISINALNHRRTNVVLDALIHYVVIKRTCLMFCYRPHSQSDMTGAYIAQTALFSYAIHHHKVLVDVRHKVSKPHKES